MRAGWGGWNCGLNGWCWPGEVLFCWPGLGLNLEGGTKVLLRTACSASGDKLERLSLMRCLRSARDSVFSSLEKTMRVCSTSLVPPRVSSQSSLGLVKPKFIRDCLPPGYLHGAGGQTGDREAEGTVVGVPDGKKSWPRDPLPSANACK